MIKVKNDRISINITKNGKVIKTIDLRNRLTNYYLNYIMNKIYPNAGWGIVDNDPIDIVFSTAYLVFNTPITVADTDTTLPFNLKSESLFPDQVKLEKNARFKRTLIDYFFDLSAVPNGTQIVGIGFGRDELWNNDYLFAYLDLTTLNLRVQNDIGIGFVRVDEIESNAVGNIDYLPFTAPGEPNEGELIGIDLYRDPEAQNLYDSYILSNLTKTITGVGEVEITGFNPFVINESGLFPSDTLFPSATLYPQNIGKVQSVNFIYRLTDNNIVSAYVNIKDLGIEYDNTEIKIKIKCERGDY